MVVVMLAGGDLALRAVPLGPAGSVARDWRREKRSGGDTARGLPDASVAI